MNRKSIIQEYVILATNEKGSLSSNGKVGAVASGITDLMINGVVTLDNKKLEIKKDLPEELSYLAPLYEYLSEKPRTMNKVMDDYCMGMTDKKFKELIANVGENLVSEGIATKGNGGLLGNKEVCIPEAGNKEKLIATVKEEIMQKEELSAHDMSLICILQETKSLKQYLSKYEKDILKENLKSMRKDPKNKELKEMINYVEAMMAAMVACIVVIAN